MSYKITFTFRSAPAFTTPPVFDALLAYCWMQEHYPNAPEKLNIAPDELIDFSTLPITQHADDYFLASRMFWDEQESITDSRSWKKRWADECDELADFGGNMRKVKTNSGEFKSYQVPLPLTAMRQCWFFFDSGDVEEVRRLVSKHLWGIGKKTSRGHGEIKGFEIETIDFDPFVRLCRPIPVRTLNKTAVDSMLADGATLQYRSWRPPYWLPANMEMCVTI